MIFAPEIGVAQVFVAAHTSAGFMGASSRKVLTATIEFRMWWLK